MAFTEGLGPRKSGSAIESCAGDVGPKSAPKHDGKRTAIVRVLVEHRAGWEPSLGDPKALGLERLKALRPHSDGNVWRTHLMTLLEGARYGQLTNPRSITGRHVIAPKGARGMAAIRKGPPDGAALRDPVET
jgi:hypothetical protein